MGRAYQNRKDSMAKTSDAKAKMYSKLSREIYVCAKAGGTDPDGNLTLRGLIDKAKKSQVPSHVIDKALDKASGSGGEDFAVARYEGYGPGGCMAIIDCLTDNPNRTFGDVRQCFTKTKCEIGKQGVVMHMFDHVAIFVFKGDDEEAILEALLMDDVDVEDVEAEGELITVFAAHTEYSKVKISLENAGIKDFEVDEIQFVPKMTKPLNDADKEMFEKFITMLNDLDDVQNIYHDLAL